jgi:hypothetical protein
MKSEAAMQDRGFQRWGGKVRVGRDQRTDEQVMVGCWRGGLQGGTDAEYARSARAPALVPAPASAGDVVKTVARLEGNAAYQSLAPKSDEQLFASFERTFDLAGGQSTGRRMIEHFRSNRGTEFYSGPESALSRAIVRNRRFQEFYFLSVVPQIKRRLETMVRQRFVDFAQLRLCVALGGGDLPHFKAVPDSLPLLPNESRLPAACIGGIQGLDILARGARFEAGSLLGLDRSVHMTLRFVLHDDFGVGDNDAYAAFGNDGIVAMWILQHNRGYRTFQTRTVVDVPTVLLLW